MRALAAGHRARDLVPAPDRVRVELRAEDFPSSSPAATGQVHGLQAEDDDGAGHCSHRRTAHEGDSLKGLPNLAPYVASKHALVGLVRTAARETALHGIRVNLVAPGSVNTPMFINDATAQLYAPDDEAPGTETLLERSRAGVPMGMPYVQPEDITEAVLYLASDAARYITGAVLSIDGEARFLNANDADVWEAGIKVIIGLCDERYPEVAQVLRKALPAETLDLAISGVR